MAKIRDVVSKTKEYNRLQAMITNIESALADMDKTNMDKTNTVEDVYTWKSGILTLNGFTFASAKEKRADVTINAEVNELIRDDLKVLLKRHLEELKAKQEALEI